VPSGTIDRPITISLPDGQAGEHDALVELVIRARDDLSKALGIEAPARISLRTAAMQN
jgi:hypothetical protein